MVYTLMQYGIAIISNVTVKLGLFELCLRNMHGTSFEQGTPFFKQYLGLEDNRDHRQLCLHTTIKQAFI